MKTILTNQEIQDLIFSIHYRLSDFTYSDIPERINKHDYFELVEIELSKINLDEWFFDNETVDEYVGKILENIETMPIPVISFDKSIIDGTHRLNALNELGIKKTKVYLGRKIY